MLVNTISENKPGSGKESDTWFERVFSSDYIYQATLRASDTHEAQRVALILINLPGTADAVCDRRVTESQILRQLREIRPKLIVLDYWLDPQSCLKSSATRELLDELQVTSAHIPIVIAQGTYTEGDLKSRFPSVFRQTQRCGLVQNEVVTMPYLPVSARITSGLATLNADNRKVPISWPAYPSIKVFGVNCEPFESRRELRWTNGLSIAAAEAYGQHYDRATLNRVEEIKRMCSGSKSDCRHPFSSFLNEENFIILSANDLDNPIEEQTQIAKSPTEERLKYNREAAKLRDKVVIIGFESGDEDMHDTVIGKVRGAVLQAEYVEAILDGRIFMPIRWWSEALIGLIWFAFLVIPYWGWSTSHPIRAIFATVLLAVVPWVVLRNVVIPKYRVYPNVLISLVPYLTVAMTAASLEQLRKRNEEAPGK